MLWWLGGELNVWTCQTCVVWPAGSGGREARRGDAVERDRDFGEAGAHTVEDPALRLLGGGRELRPVELSHLEPPSFACEVDPPAGPVVRTLVCF